MSNEAQIRYRKKAIKTVYLDLNLKTDADIVEWLESLKRREGSQSGEIKHACRNLIPRDSYRFLDNWHCPSCPAKYTPVEGQLISYCPRCGQAIINTAGKNCTPVDTEQDCTPVDTEQDCTPVDTEQDCTPVDTEQDCTPVDTVTEESTPDLNEIMCDDPGTLYEVVYMTKKGGERYHSMNIYAKNAKEAVANFKTMYSGVNGHAFRIKARKPYEREKLGSFYPETEDIPAIRRKVPTDNFLTGDFALNELRKEAIQKAARNGKRLAIVRAGNRVWKYSVESGELVEAGYNPMK